VPLLVALRKQGMKERHWEQISEKVGKTVAPNPSFTFQTCLDLKLMDHVNFCVEIGEKAAKEFQIENMLNEMTTIWQDINF
jgi:dynein heavy chain, axonemal